MLLFLSLGSLSTLQELNLNMMVVFQEAAIAVGGGSDQTDERSFAVSDGGSSPDSDEDQDLELQAGNGPTFSPTPTYFALP